MLLRDFTKPEIEYLLDKCNFTEEEERYFLLRTRDKSNVQISFFFGNERFRNSS